MQRRPQMSRRPSVGGKNQRPVQFKPPAPKLARLQSHKKPKKPAR
jgi:hypothetical protein